MRYPTSSSKSNLPSKPEDVEQFQKQLEKRSDNHRSILLLPSIDGLIADALETLQVEISLLRRKTGLGKQLSPQDARTFQGYIRLLIEMAEESRKRARDPNAELENMSDAELAALAREAVETNGEGK